jgi:putative aldouronate transport system permease protein
MNVVKMKKRPFNTVSTPVSVAIHIFFIICSAACLLPLLMVISVSLTDENMVLRVGYKLIPSIFSLDSYRFLALDIDQILRSYGISAFVTVVGTVISLVLTALFAYPLFRKDFPFRRFFALFLFITMIFNGGLVPFYLLYIQYLGLRDSIAALILPYLLSPFYVIVMRSFFTGAIPDSLIESAKLDGARERTILLLIVVPLSKAAFATIGLFTTLVYWNDWFMSLLFITSRENISIQYYMYKTIQNMQFMLTNPDVRLQANNIVMPSESLRMAMAVVGMGPIVFVYPFFQKHFVKGLTVGAVKG